MGRTEYPLWLKSAWQGHSGGGAAEWQESTHLLKTTQLNRWGPGSRRTAQSAQTTIHVVRSRDSRSPLVFTSISPDPAYQLSSFPMPLGTAAKVQCVREDGAGGHVVKTTCQKALFPEPPIAVLRGKEIASQLGAA